jgi:endonuclease YncB( thermonuclease family)
MWMVCGVVAAAGLTGGCQSVISTVLPSPTPEPTPLAPPIPKPDVFDPNDGITKLTPLNDPADAGNKLPDKFRVTQVDSGELVRIQTVTKVQSGSPPKEVNVYGNPDVARLAGIVAPAPGQPGWADAVKTVQSWTLGQEVDVEQDPKFPVDLNSRRMVQIFFNGRTPKTKETRFNLNRMMVRSGYAVVDLNAATSIDVKPWLNDEQYARNKKLGLWGKGIILAGRVPLPRPAPLGARPGAVRSTPQNQTTSNTNITTSATGSVPGDSPAANVPPPPVP